MKAFNTFRKEVRWIDRTFKNIWNTLLNEIKKIFFYRYPSHLRSSKVWENSPHLKSCNLNLPASSVNSIDHLELSLWPSLSSPFALPVQPRVQSPSFVSLEFCSLIRQDAPNAAIAIICLHQRSVDNVTRELHFHFYFQQQCKICLGASKCIKFF